jgi:transposase
MLDTLGGGDVLLADRAYFSKLKHFRAVATRFENHSENYLALVKLASAKIWMRLTSR